MYEEVKVSLTPAQAKKLVKGQPFQLAHHQISGGALKHCLALHPANAKKVKRAARQQKGVRLVMTPMEVEASGEGLKEMWQGVKRAGKWVKEKVIDTPFYQKNVKPLVRAGVDTGLELTSPYLSIASPLVNKGVYKLGEKTGAYGLRGKKKKAATDETFRGQQIQYMPYIIEDGMQTFLNPLHPAMNPTMPYLPPIGRQASVSGGSFKPSGGSFMPA